MPHKRKPEYPTISKALDKEWETRLQTEFGIEYSGYSEGLHCTMSYRNWKQLVTRLSGEYTQRKNAALRIREKESSSLPSNPVILSEAKNLNWKTPTHSETEGGVIMEKTGDLKFKLRDQVTWPTPTTSDQEQNLDTFHRRAKRLKDRHKEKTGNGAGMTLGTSVKQNWSTPATAFSAMIPEKKKRNSDSLATQAAYPTPTATMAQKYGMNKSQQDLETLARSGQLHRDLTSTNGKNLEPSEEVRLLNPAWVAQLMGTTLEKTFFACSEMESSDKQQQKHGSTYGANS